MDAARMWERFAGAGKALDEDGAWAFGGDPDGLAVLVLAGTKTATSSAFPLYEAEGETLPKAGEYSVILNGRAEAVCVVRTVRVSVVPFSQVDARHAYLEGEGDRSLAYWRAVHERFFAEAMEAAGLCFTQDMPVVLEEFEVVYREGERECRF